MQPKQYQITDLSQLEAIRAWVLDPANRSTLVCELVDGVESYRVLVEDREGHMPVEDLFLASFAQAVTRVE